MKMSIGGNVFDDVEIPLLWGDKAVLQDEHGGISVVDLSGKEARLQILGNIPADGVDYRSLPDGYEIAEEGESKRFQYFNGNKSLVDPSGKLPNCMITDDGIMVGSSVLQSNVMTGSMVGIKVNEDGFTMGTNLPSGLAELTI